MIPFSRGASASMGTILKVGKFEIFALPPQEPGLLPTTFYLNVCSCALRLEPRARHPPSQGTDWKPCFLSPCTSGQPHLA